MTRAEADVCYKYRLQVTVSPKQANENGFSSDKCFFITRTEKVYDTKLRTISYTAVLSGDGRALYHMDVSYLNYLEAQEGFVQSKVIQKKNRMFLSMLKEIYSEYKTKKAVYQFIGKKIDELKGELK